MNILKSRSFHVLVIFLLVGVGLSFLIFWFHPTSRYARQVKKGLSQVEEEIKKEEALYANDTYGGKTPEETYQMFLAALQKQDIELASKYFILDKQAEYKALLEQIKTSGHWEEMMKDLLALRNQVGKFDGERKDLYVINVINDQNTSVATIVLALPVNNLTQQNAPLGKVWKIIEF